MPFLPPNQQRQPTVLWYFTDRKVVHRAVQLSSSFAPLHDYMQGFHLSICPSCNCHWPWLAKPWYPRLATFAGNVSLYSSKTRWSGANRYVKQSKSITIYINSRKRYARTIRVSSGKRWSIARRFVSSGLRVISASNFCASFARICARTWHKWQTVSVYAETEAWL